MRTHAVALSLLLPLLGPACSPELSDREILLATTTSVQDSGLLDELLPDFRDQTGIAVRTIAVGTGAALRMGFDIARKLVDRDLAPFTVAKLDTGENPRLQPGDACSHGVRAPGEEDERATRSAAKIEGVNHLREIPGEHVPVRSAERHGADDGRHTRRRGELPGQVVQRG